MATWTHRESMQGGCLCGAIRYQVDGRPLRTTNCHCLDCRLSSGAVFITWMEFHPDDFHLLSGAPSRHQSSPRVTRQFCASCGTQLTYQHADEQNVIDVTACSLDQVDTVMPQDHVWCDRMAPWVKLADGLPRFGRGKFDD